MHCCGDYGWGGRFTPRDHARAGSHGFAGHGLVLAVLALHADRRAFRVISANCWVRHELLRPLTLAEYGSGLLSVVTVWVTNLSAALLAATA